MAEAEVRAVLESCLDRVIQQNQAHQAQGSLPLTAGQATIIALSSLSVVSLAILCLVVPSVREHVRDMAQHIWGYVQHLVAAMEACAGSSLQHQELDALGLGHAHKHAGSVLPTLLLSHITGSYHQRAVTGSTR